MRILCHAKDSHIFSTKNNSIFLILPFEILTSLTNDLVNFKQLAPGVWIFTEFPYGDQGLFMSKRKYKEVGGFPAYYLMEDYILVR